MILPLFYQACLSAQLSQIQFLTLQMLLQLLQKERNISIERLATLFAQPMLFESRRRNLQRFLILPQLTPQALWFPILKHWLKTHSHRGQPLRVVIDRTNWQHHNLLMVSLVYHKRAIPLFWQLLDHQGQSNLAQQQAVLLPVLRLLRPYQLIVLGDREFHSVALGQWLEQMEVVYVLRLPKSITVKLNLEREFERLDQLSQYPGFSSFEVLVQVTQQQGFGRFNLASRWKRVYRSDKATQVWYLLTNLDTLELALSAYASRFCIEPMFRDFKSGGYCMEATQANDERFLALVLLIAMAYTIASERGKRIRCQGIAKYIARVKEPKRVQRRHSDFWLGLYGSLWVESMQIWGEWAEQLMALKPQKRPFYLRGLRTMSLMQSAF
jgi:Transposase DDE domain